MEQTGKCIAVCPLQSGVSARTGNPWMSQEFVLEVPGQYTKRMCFKVFGEDRIKQFNIQPDHTYNVQFDIDAHEHNGRWYNSINAFNVIYTDAVQPQQQPPQPTQSQPLTEQQLKNWPPNDIIPAGAPIPQTEDSNLPF